MNHKLKGNKLIHGDIVLPEIVIAEFDEGFDYKPLVNALNHGHEMLMTYKSYRNNLHINNVVEMLEKMEEIFHEWEVREMEIRRNYDY